MIVYVFGKADEYGYSTHRLTNLGNSLLGSLAQAGVEQQVLRRIATDTELWKHNEISPHLIASAVAY